MTDKLLTPEQVAERLQVTERTVYRWLTEGRLEGVRLGRLWRIRPEVFEAFLRANTPSEPGKVRILRTPGKPGTAGRPARSSWKVVKVKYTSVRGE